MTYEQVLGLDLGHQIDFPLFVRILMIMGYVNSKVDAESGEVVPKMSQKEEDLVSLAWQTVKTKSN